MQDVRILKVGSYIWLQSPNTTTWGVVGQGINTICSHGRADFYGVTLVNLLPPSYIRHLQDSLLLGLSFFYAVCNICTHSIPATCRIARVKQFPLSMILSSYHTI